MKRTSDAPSGKGMEKLSKIKEGILEAVFPSDLYCVRCGRIIDRSRYYGLCDSCSSGIRWASGTFCEKCGRLLGDGGARICADCMNSERYFDKGYTCAFYGVYAREIMSALKVGKKSWIGRKLGKAMADRMALTDEEPDLAVPVPAHIKKEKERGYNQASVIARQFSESLREKKAGKTESQGPLYFEALVRSRQTAPMKGLSLWARRENMLGAVSVKKDAAGMIRGKTIALIDDIMTTGSTLSECARVLKEAGAGRIIAVTFASGGDMVVYEREEK